MKSYASNKKIQNEVYTVIYRALKFQLMALDLV